jgi:hypothetical protein
MTRHQLLFQRCTNATVACEGWLHQRCHVPSWVHVDALLQVSIWLYNSLTIRLGFKQLHRMRQSHIHNVEKRRLMKLERAMRKESEKSEQMQKREAHQRAQIKRRVCRNIPMHQTFRICIRNNLSLFPRLSLSLSFPLFLSGGSSILSFPLFLSGGSCMINHHVMDLTKQLSYCLPCPFCR